MNPFHVAIIMDGNGRWAAARGLPRLAGHRRGVEALRRSLEKAVALGITTMTVYAFSSDNWKRPESEVTGIMNLLRAYITKETARCRREGVRVQIIGRRDRLAADLVRLIETAETVTAACSRITLRIAVDYSSRDTLIEAARRCSVSGDWSREGLARALNSPEVDLLIRTGGEQRLSDYLLWESAYAELFFTDCMWPDFGSAELEAAVRDFRSRHRRFGRIA